MKKRGLVPIVILTIAVLGSGIAIISILGSSEGGSAYTPAVSPLTRAKVAFVDDDFDEAANLLKRHLTSIPDSLEAQVLLGRVELERGRLPEARDLFVAILKNDPENFHAARGLGIVYRGLGQKELAVVHLSKAASLRKKDPRIRKELALAQREKGDTFGALSTLQEALDLDKGQADLTGLMTALALETHRASPFGTQESRGAAAPGRPAFYNPRSAIPRPQAPDPTSHFPKPSRQR